MCLRRVGGVGLIVVGVLVRDRGGMPRSAGDLAVQPPVVVPVDVFEGGVLDGADVVPRASVVDQLLLWINSHLNRPLKLSIMALS